MKKKLVAVVAACMALALAGFALAGCSSSSASNNTANTNAAAKTTLIVGFDQEYPPYGFVGNDGQFTGFDLDLATEVAKRNGWDIKLEAIDWDTKDAQVNAGTITCIWNGFTMEGREDDYTFSDPYMLNEQVIVVKKGTFADEKALAGKVVMTQAGSGALEVLEDEEGQKALADTFKELQTIADYNNAFMQLESGVVDAVACDLSIAKYQMSANADKYEIIYTLSSEHYGVGFKKGNTEMAKTVTDTLKAMDKDGFVKELCKKYDSYGLTYDNWVLGK